MRKADSNVGFAYESGRRSGAVTESAHSHKQTLAVSRRGTGSVHLRTLEYSQFIGDDVAAPVSHALGSGFHSLASRSASAIWAGVIFLAGLALYMPTVFSQLDRARLYHM